VLASLDPGTETLIAAANAPAPAWRCGQCFAETPSWTAICPNCGKAGTLVWKQEKATLPSLT
jgi:predicted amidophosphoribosyltransferase